MAWTTPRTWVASEVVTASVMNTHVRDNLAALGDPRTSYSPAWTASTTNPVINNGTITGRYAQQGKRVEFSVEIVCGSSTTYGSGLYSVSLPVAAVAGIAQLVAVLVDDVSAGTRWSGAGRIASGGSTVDRMIVTDNSSGITPTVPFTFANTDRIVVSGAYEAA